MGRARGGGLTSVGEPESAEPEPRAPEIRSSTRAGGRVALVAGLLLALGAVLGGGGLSAQEDPDAAAKPALWEQGGRCQTCHVEDDWGVILEPDPKEGFDHAETGFPLRGAHVGVRCEDCHRAGLEALTASCARCHLDPHAGFNTVSCEQCHDERSWEVARTFAFHERTRFPLTGVHASIQCEACHRNRRGEPAPTIPTECLACHAEDFRISTPNHAAANFTECGECHSTSTFRQGRFTHATYQLIGQHQSTATCEACHPGTDFVGRANGGNDCIVCHADDFQATVALSQQPGSAVPAHPGAFPTTCTMAGCHTAAATTFITWDFNGMPGR